MIISKSVTLARRGGHSPQRAPAGRLHAPPAMQQILARERNRADRTGDGFSLLIFTPGEEDIAEKALEPIARFLQRRLRLTDDVGWLETGVLAAVLPHTPAEGAAKLADEVRLAALGATPPPACTVYTYPSVGDAEAPVRHSADRQRRRVRAAGQ